MDVEILRLRTIHGMYKSWTWIAHDLGLTAVNGADWTLAWTDHASDILLDNWGSLPVQFGRCVVIARRMPG